MFCTRPSSATTKSLAVSPWTGWLLESRTTTSTMTRRTVARKVGVLDGMASGFGGCVWESDWADASPQSEDSSSNARTGRAGTDIAHLIERKAYIGSWMGGERGADSQRLGRALRRGLWWRFRVRSPTLVSAKNAKTRMGHLRAHRACF